MITETLFPIEKDWDSTITFSISRGKDTKTNKITKIVLAGLDSLHIDHCYRLTLRKGEEVLLTEPGLIPLLLRSPTMVELGGGRPKYLTLDHLFGDKTYERLNAHLNDKGESLKLTFYFGTEPRILDMILYVTTESLLMFNT
jgi:hypothetical protein